MIIAICRHRNNVNFLDIEIQGEDCEDCAKKALNIWFEDGQLKKPRGVTSSYSIDVYVYGEKFPETIHIWIPAEPLTLLSSINIIKEFLSEIEGSDYEEMSLESNIAIRWIEENAIQKK